MPASVKINPKENTVSATAQTVPPNAGAAPAERARTDLIDVSIAELEQGGGTNIRELDPKGLAELVESVKKSGVLEPVLVRRGSNGIQLIAGFRRVAAAAAAGHKTVPARLLLIDEKAALEVQLVENLQREDLTELEEARALQAYLDGTKSTQQQLGERIGKSQPYVANRLRLLALPKPVAKLLEDGKISATHAQVLLTIPKEADEKGEYAAEIATRAVKQGTSTADFQRQVSRDVETWREKQAFSKKMESTKFPKCPSCKAPATEERYGGKVGHDGNYNAAHTWSPATGKTEAQVQQEERAKYEKRAGASSSSRPKPKAVDCRESASLRSAHDPLALIQAALKQAGAAGIPLIEYDATGGSGRCQAVLRIGLSSKLLGDVHVIARPVTYATGERTQYVVQDGLGPARHASKAKVQSWERAQLPAVKSKAGKPREFDPKQLLGTAQTVNGRLSKIRQDPELLELARAAEASGKHRAAVLDYIDEALLGRPHDGYSFHYDRRL